MLQSFSYIWEGFFFLSWAVSITSFLVPYLHFPQLQDWLNFNSWNNSVFPPGKELLMSSVCAHCIQKISISFISRIGLDVYRGGCSACRIFFVLCFAVFIPPAHYSLSVNYVTEGTFGALLLNASLDIYFANTSTSVCTDAVVSKMSVWDGSSEKSWSQSNNFLFTLKMIAQVNEKGMVSVVDSFQLRVFFVMTHYKCGNFSCCFWEYFSCILKTNMKGSIIKYLLVENRRCCCRKEVKGAKASKCCRFIWNGLFIITPE